MARVIDVIRKIHNVLAFIEKVLMLVPLVIIFVLVVAQVLSRYILKTGILWSDELIAYLTILMAMMGSAIAVREKAHTDLRLFIDKAPKLIAKIMQACIDIITVGFLCFLIIAGIAYAKTAATQYSFVLGISMAIPYSVMPLGGTLMLLEYILLRLKITKTTTAGGLVDEYL